MPDSKPTAYVKFVNLQTESMLPCLVLDTPDKDVWVYTPGLGWSLGWNGGKISLVSLSRSHATIRMLLSKLRLALVVNEDHRVGNHQIERHRRPRTQQRSHDE